MRLWMKKAAVVLSLVMLVNPSLVSAATAEGQMTSVAEFAPGLWKITVRGADGEQDYMVSTKTTIQKEVPVEMLKAGDRLVVKGKGKGTKGFKAPFGNMSESAKKALGLPNVPGVPEVPKVPQLPSKQQMQGSPSSKGSGGGGGKPAPAGPAGQGGAAPSGGGGMGAPKKSVEEPKVKTQDEMLQEKGFQNEKLLFPPKEDVSKPGNEVTQVNKTDLGFEVTVVSATGKPAKQTYAPGKKVLTVLSLKEVKKDDKVFLNFNDEDKTVTELKVKG